MSKKVNNDDILPTISKKRSYDEDENIQDDDIQDDDIQENVTNGIATVTKDIYNITNDIRITKIHQRILRSEIDFQDEEYYVQKERLRQSLRLLGQSLPLSPKKVLNHLKADLILRQEEVEELMNITKDLEDELNLAKKTNAEAYLRGLTRLKISKMIN